MITTSIPNTWQDLQEDVACILRECGFSAEVEKVFTTARGNVEVDVYAEEMVNDRRYVILCECKHWKSSVPQTVIHAFRSVVADTGANIGYIIGTSGFQSGAFTASDLTNIELVTWEEFQDKFEPTWLKNFLSPEITEHLDPIFSYIEHLVPRWVDLLTEEDAEQFSALRNQFGEFGWLMMDFTTYGQPTRGGVFPKLPYLRTAVRLPPDERERVMRGVPRPILEASGYREFLEAALEYGKEGITKFRAIRDRYA